MRSETILISKEQFEAFMACARKEDGSLWDQIKDHVQASHLNDLMEAWKNCEDKDGSGIVSIRALARELGLT